LVKSWRRLLQTAPEMRRPRGDASTTIHVLSDVNGLPPALHPTPGQTADIAAAADLLALAEARPRELLADAGCGRRRPARGAASVERTRLFLGTSNCNQRGTLDRHRYSRSIAPSV
jgi:hypothetical protein